MQSSCELKVSRKTLILSTLSVFTVVCLSLNFAYQEGRDSGLKHGFVNGQIKLLNLMSRETGDFPENFSRQDYREIYGTKTFSVYVHRNERSIVVTGQY